jgi:hypothetical protein
MSACTICRRWCPSTHYCVSDYDASITQVEGACLQVKCRACDAIQCHGNGTGNGCCKVCFYGRLPGWSFGREPKTCQYKGCDEPAVYSRLPGSKKACCAKHGRQIIHRRTQ